MMHRTVERLHVTPGIAGVLCLVLLLAYQTPVQAQPNFDPSSIGSPPPAAPQDAEAIPKAAQDMPQPSDDSGKTPDRAEQPAENLLDNEPYPEVPPYTYETEPSSSIIPDTLTMTLSVGSGVEFDFRKAWYTSEAQIFTGMYEGLFTYNPVNMRPIMGVISKYELSSDKKQWTFTIRENARYSNGEPVRAEDFRTSWLSLLAIPDAPYSSLFDIIEGAEDFRTGKLTDANRVGIQVQEGKLIVTLTSPAAFLPSMLCHHSFGVVHPDTRAMLDSGSFDPQRFISNGPFIMSEADEQHITFEKNPLYWDAVNVKLKKIVIKFIDDADEATALWNSGQARWIAGNMNLDTLTDRVGIQLNPMFGTHYYFIRSDEAPWNDYRVRKALTLALPWNEIRENYMLPAKTLILPLQGYPEIEGMAKTDIDAALKLLAEAGYPKGVGLPELVIKIGDYSDAKRLAEIMATAWLEKLGVPVRIKTVSSYNYSDTLKEHDYQVGYMSWIGDFADPYTFLLLFRQGSNLNEAGYSDPDYENLIQKSMTEEGAARMSTLAKAEEMLLDRGIVLPIYYTPALNIVDTDELEGWYPNMLDIHPFKYLKFAMLKPLPGVAFAPKK
ncbi:MAG: peptide ABC transporter substrate-binding protein [Treponema sp.]|jgi:peptide/nickel transport system substrate-binding protein/oligopeptide transport system substrate-binding protein|nr:peptide ABC transporter substrate-binding protein [Treponema sp.]